MLKIIFESKFEKDYKILQKKHYDISKIKTLVELIASEVELTAKYKHHYLKGNLQGYQECHVESNLLIIYQIVGDELFLCRVGTHRDLLNK